MKLSIILLPLTVLLPSAVYAQPYRDHMADWHMFGWGYGSLFMWALFILLIGLILYAVSRNSSSGPNDSSNETPLEIVKKRYARGEISKEEFEAVKRDLSQ